MLRRVLSILYAMTAVVAVHAALATGSWRQYPSFGEFTSLADTGTTLWYISAGSLYSYDKDADETRHYQSGRQLSDHTPEAVFVNHEGGYVLVTYSNANIDLIYPDDRIVNLPDIKDVQVNVEKKIRTVSFHDGRIYVATEFGLVIYDDSRMEVVQSGIYNEPVSAVCATPYGILMTLDRDSEKGARKLYHIPHGERINKIDNFKTLGVLSYSIAIDRMMPVSDDGRRIAVTSGIRTWYLTVDPEAYKASFGLINHYIHTDGDLMAIADGTVWYLTDDNRLFPYLTTVAESEAAMITLPEFLKGDIVTFSGDPLRSLWAASSAGLGNYRITPSAEGGDTEVTVLRDKSVPTDATSFSNVARFFPSPSHGSFYISNIGQVGFHPSGEGDRLTEPMTADLYHDGTFSRVETGDVSAKTTAIVNLHNKGAKGIYSPQFIAEDPTRPGRLCIGTSGEGVYVIEDGKEVAKFDGDNSPIVKAVNWIWSTPDGFFDKEGNLWVGSWTYDTPSRGVVMLPAAAMSRAASVSASDWLVPDFADHLKDKQVRLLNCSHSNTVVALDNGYKTGFAVYTHNGTPTDLADDAARSWRSLTDQDGKIFNPSYWQCMAEDKRGQVWLGTSQGVVAITNPLRALQPDFAIHRIKVPRNDGSGLADYLLESETVYAIAVDHADRKWIGTKNSGLFLVSENGDEIIANYTTSNSPLPTNSISDLFVDPNSGSVFVATTDGLYEYSSTAGPPADDYSDVYAYPNPVTPDFSGWVTITGLMDSSLVKITDSGMHLVAQTMSEGGTALWDCRDINGRRVRSGVYYVVASTGAESSSSGGGVVAKIMVVN